MCVLTVTPVILAYLFIVYNSTPLATLLVLDTHCHLLVRRKLYKMRPKEVH